MFTFILSHRGTVRLCILCSRLYYLRFHLHLLEAPPCQQNIEAFRLEHSTISESIIITMFGGPQNGEG